MSTLTLCGPYSAHCVWLIIVCMLVVSVYFMGILNVLHRLTLTIICVQKMLNGVYEVFAPLVTMKIRVPPSVP